MDPTPDIPASPASESGVTLPPKGAARQSTLRLVISVPALLVLFTLGFGLISYLLITSKWDELEVHGQGNVAVDLLQGHLIAMMALTLLSIGAGLGIVYSILKPLRAIEATARGIIEGRLDQRAPNIRSANEIGSLSSSFNSMIDFLNSCIEDRNRYMVEGIMTGLLLVDLEGRIKALNATGARLLGLDPTRAIGLTLRELPREAPESGGDFWNDVERTLRGDLSRMTDEVILNSAVGGISLMVALSVLRDSRRAPFGLMLNFRDAAEMRNLNEQLGKADQLAALGTFTMGLAHELRNPLGSIKGMIQLLAMESPQTVEAKEIIERVVREVNRLDRFVRELLDFSHEAPAPPGELDLAELLRRSLAQVEGDFDPEVVAGLSVIQEIQPLPRVVGEPDRLVQAFSNILRNAFEAARPGSELAVRASVEPGSEGEQVVVRFHNTGSTIKANDLGKIFDPFFSTKERGTGLGLAIAYQILTQNGARMDVEVGADEVEFSVRFPVPIAAASGAVPPARESIHI